VQVTLDRGKTSLIIDDIKSLTLADFKAKGAKKYLILALVSFLLFISSLSFMLIRQQRIATLERYEKMLEKAYQKGNASEAALIYKDRNKARELLKEAQNLTEELLFAKYKEKEVLESNLY